MLLCSILLTVLTMASWIGIDVYSDTTTRLHGYGSGLFLLLESPSCMHLTSS